MNRSPQTKSKRATRRDYINIQRRMIKLLRENHINMQMPYFPQPVLTNERLAAKLGVSERTVRRHKKRTSDRLWKKIEAETIWDVWKKMHDIS